jgi:tRNA-splicing ligase RtcB
MTAMHHIDGYKLLNFASQIDDNTIEQANETVDREMTGNSVPVNSPTRTGQQHIGPAIAACIPRGC